LLKKQDRDEEFYYAPTKKGKGAKKSAAKPDGEDKKKSIKHNAETFKLFDNLKLDAPLTTADIPDLLVKLDAQMEMYQAKVKDWEQNREALKAKILAGEVEEAKEEAKEEEKVEVKEEEKKEDA